VADRADEQAADKAADRAADKAPRERSPLRLFLELLVLTSFAVAQPLLDVTGRSPETFVFYRVDGLEVVVYALLILVVPPLLLWLLVTLLSVVSRSLGRIAYAVIAGGLIALTVLEAGKKLTDLRGPALVVVSVAVAAGVVWLVARSETAQSFVTYLIPAPLVFALLFVATSPTGALVRPADTEESTTSSEAGDSAPPVVMILLDEFPLQSLLNSKGEVDARVFPNFAKLAERSHWYRNATGVSGFTQYAVPAVLSGQYPKAKLAPSYVQHPNNIFSLLAPDYRIRAFETITQLCDPALCDEADQPSGSNRGMSGLFRQTWQVAKKLAKPYDDSAPISDQFAEESAGKTTKKPKLTIDKAQTQPNWKTLRANQPERFQRFVAGLKPSDEPTMHFLHLLLPHHPWRYLPSGATHQPRLLGGVAGGWGTYSWPMEVNRQSHLLQLAYTDRLLGDVIDRMEKQGIWDDSLVVVTADHGESFIPGTAGRRLTPGPDTEAQVAWVPVFLKEPGQKKGKTSDANWEQVDLLPTMADALDTDVPFKVDGISQLSGTRDRTEKTFYNSPGDRMEFPGAPGFRIVLEGVTDTLVRGSLGQEGLYVMGSRPDWIGKKVSSLTSLGVDVSGAPSPMSAHLSSEIDFDAVDPASGLVPALVTGRLQQSAGRGPVVIAVNGTVAAVSEVYPEIGKPSFAGYVNDKLFKAGKNDLKLYEVVGDTDPQLRPIQIR
jgi:Sulfatase